MENQIMDHPSFEDNNVQDYHYAAYLLCSSICKNCECNHATEDFHCILESIHNLPGFGDTMQTIIDGLEAELLGHSNNFNSFIYSTLYWQLQNLKDLVSVASNPPDTTLPDNGIPDQATLDAGIRPAGMFIPMANITIDETPV